ncbi:MAG: hypothetical protein ACR2PT_20750 [Endozoicomonas sp.]
MAWDKKQNRQTELVQFSAVTSENYLFLNWWGRILTTWAVEMGLHFTVTKALGGYHALFWKRRQEQLDARGQRHEQVLAITDGGQGEVSQTIPVKPQLDATGGGMAVLPGVKTTDVVLAETEPRAKAGAVVSYQQKVDVQVPPYVGTQQPPAAVAVLDRESMTSPPPTYANLILLETQGQLTGTLKRNKRLSGILVTPAGAGNSAEDASASQPDEYESGGSYDEETVLQEDELALGADSSSTAHTQSSVLRWRDFDNSDNLLTAEVRSLLESVPEKTTSEEIEVLLSRYGVEIKSARESLVGLSKYRLDKVEGEIKGLPIDASDGRRRALVDRLDAEKKFSEKELRNQQRLHYYGAVEVIGREMQISLSGRATKSIKGGLSGKMYGLMQVRNMRRSDTSTLASTMIKPMIEKIKSKSTLVKIAGVREKRIDVQSAEIASGDKSEDAIDVFEDAMGMIPAAKQSLINTRDDNIKKLTALEKRKQEAEERKDGRNQAEIDYLAGQVEIMETEVRKMERRVETVEAFVRDGGKSYDEVLKDATAIVESEMFEELKMSYAAAHGKAMQRKDNDSWRKRILSAKNFVKAEKRFISQQAGVVRKLNPDTLDRNTRSEYNKDSKTFLNNRVQDREDEIREEFLRIYWEIQLATLGPKKFAELKDIESLSPEDVNELVLHMVESHRLNNFGHIRDLFEIASQERLVERSDYLEIGARERAFRFAYEPLTMIAEVAPQKYVEWLVRLNHRQMTAESLYAQYESFRVFLNKSWLEARGLSDMQLPVLPDIPFEYFQEQPTVLRDSLSLVKATDATSTKGRQSLEAKMSAPEMQLLVAINHLYYLFSGFTQVMSGITDADSELFAFISQEIAPLINIIGEFGKHALEKLNPGIANPSSYHQILYYFGNHLALNTDAFQFRW